MNLPILSAIIRKETREALREKQLKIILIVGLIMPLFLAFTTFRADKLDRAERHKESVAQKPAETKDHDDTANQGTDKGEKKESAAPLFLVLMSWCYGLFMSAIYASTLALESFVGEKERQTIEVLLASPASDYDLFWGKFISCGLIAVVLGLCMGVINLSVGITISHILGISISWLMLGLVIIISSPLFLFIIATFTSLGVILSSRASTVKGAGQLFGLVLTALIFIPMMTLPLLPSGFIKGVIEVISQIPIYVIIASVVLFLVALNWILLSIAIATFRREKILTAG